MKDKNTPEDVTGTEPHRRSRKAAEAEPAVETMPEAVAEAAGRAPAAPAARTRRAPSMRHDPAEVRRLFETGEYPYRTHIPRKDYEKQKAKLQIELLKVQEWVRDTARGS